MRRVTAAFVVCLACGSSEKPATDPGNAGTTTNASTSSSPGASASASATAQADPPHMIPGGCASNDPCVPDAVFVRRLCNGSFPDVALLLMSKTMPFAHAYLRGDVDGWNAEGGASARAKLKFDEEVLLLKKRSGNTGGIQVSGTGGYLVMRWDGNCYTLADDEVTSRKPPAAKFAPIQWRYLADATKNGLLDNEQVKSAYDRRGKECKGAVSGDVTLSCQKADEALSASVVSAVRAGASVPTPERIP
ncbi:MAG TPA: hypothetical protein VGH87_21980 [Polyangiaceae bacterium]|jgi:hypothetical protein